MFMFGAFLTGGAVGFAANRAVGESKPVASVYSERAMRDELARELSLAEGQRRHFDSVFDWRRVQSQSIMKIVRPSLDSVRDSARVLMLNSLDSTQQAAFRRLLERNQRTADSLARSRGELK